MSELENDMNLPADADDLSRHAPALFALKGTEEGFVVPALYFEELSELVVSKTSIPEDGGLVVPENYFEESAELIVAKATLPNEDGWAVPENYFEELPSIIEAKTVIPTDAGLVAPENYFEDLGANIEAQIELGNVLPPFDYAQDDKTVPAGYFDQMENELHVHIALDNVKQDEGFVVPEGYFENLADKVIAASSFDYAQFDKDINDDEVPNGYFDSLADKVVARLEDEGAIANKEERGRIIVLAQWKKYVAITAVAASVALLIVFAWTFIGNDDNGNGILIANNNDKGLVPENIVKSIPPQPIINPDSSNVVVAPQGIARELPKNPNGFKPNQENEVIHNDDIIAQTDLMDEALVMEFVSENGVVEETEEVLDPAMMEYLMNDNTSMDVFVPADK